MSFIENIKYICFFVSNKLSKLQYLIKTDTQQLSLLLSSEERHDKMCIVLCMKELCFYVETHLYKDYPDCTEV